MRHFFSARLGFLLHTAAGMRGSFLIKFFFGVLVILSMSGCEPGRKMEISPTLTAPAARSNLVNLTLVGFNYTNREIQNFSVDGSSGGNVQVSGPDGGGGGSVCCVRYVAGRRVTQHSVRWDAESCRFDDSGTGENYDLRPFYKEVMVNADGVPLERAQYFEVHFFPDGSVKAMVTREISKPLLSLPEARDRKKSPPCASSAAPSK